MLELGFIERKKMMNKFERKKIDKKNNTLNWVLVISLLIFLLSIFNLLKQCL
jgi:hypothetical protein